MDIQIPQQVAERREYQAKDGSGTRYITAFQFFHEGSLHKGQIFGDHTALITEHGKSGKALEIETLEPKSFQGTPYFQVRLSRDAWRASQGGGRGSVGGFRGGREGYRGRPLGYEDWVKHTRDLAVQMHSIVTLIAKDANAEERLAETRALVAQYWIAVKENVTVVPGFEAPAAAAAAQPAAENPLASVFNVLQAGIKAADKLEVLDGLKQTVIAHAELTDDQKVELQGAILMRKRHLGTHEQLGL